MAAESMIDVQVPRAWLAGVTDEPLTLQRIFRVGLFHYKVEQALALYREGVGSLGYIAEQLGLPKQDLIEEARRHGVELEWSDESLNEELGA
jgi:hypothetical protein